MFVNVCNYMILGWPAAKVEAVEVAVDWISQLFHW